MSLLQGECKYTNFFLSWSDRGKKLFFVVFFRTPGRVLEFCSRLSRVKKIRRASARRIWLLVKRKGFIGILPGNRTSLPE